MERLPQFPTYEHSKLGSDMPCGDGQVQFFYLDGSFIGVLDGVSGNDGNRLLKTIDQATDPRQMDARSSDWMKKVCNSEIIQNLIKNKLTEVEDLAELEALLKDIITLILLEYKKNNNVSDFFPPLIYRLVGSFALTRDGVGTVGATFGDIYIFDEYGNVVCAQHNYFDSIKDKYEECAKCEISTKIWDNLNMAILQILPLLGTKPTVDIFIEQLREEINRRNIGCYFTNHWNELIVWLQSYDENCSIYQSIYRSQDEPTAIITSDSDTYNSKLTRVQPKICRFPYPQVLIFSTDGIVKGVKFKDINNLKPAILMDYHTVIQYLIEYYKSQLIEISPIKPDDWIFMICGLLTR